MNTLDLKCADIDLLKKALAALGYAIYEANDRYLHFSGGTINLNAGKIIVQAGSEFIADGIKQQYSREVLKSAGQRFGWNMRTGAKVNTMKMVRRV